MDTAVRELHNADNGGVLVWFFELLWRAKPRPAGDYLYAPHLPPVPDTVLLNFSRIQHWYFANKRAAASRRGRKARRHRASPSAEGDTSGSDGNDHSDEDAEPSGDQKSKAPEQAEEMEARTAGRTILKKRTANLTGRSIFHSFCGFDASHDHGATAEPTGATAGGAGGRADAADARAASRAARERRIARGGPAGLDDTTTIVAMLVCRSKSAQMTNSIAGATSAGSNANDSAGAGGNGSRRGSIAGSVATSGRDAHHRGQVLERAGPSTADVKYFDVHALKHLLFHGSLGETALLQHFVRPKTSDSTASALFNARNETLQVHWQWSSCAVVRHTNNYPLGDGSRSTLERGETFEATTNTYSSMSGSASVAEPLKLACNAIAEHVFAVSEQRLVRMSAVFKADAKNRLMLLFVQSAHCASKETLFRAPEVACPDALATTLLFAGRHTTVSELHQQQREQQEDLQRRRDQQQLAQQQQQAMMLASMGADASRSIMAQSGSASPPASPSSPPSRGASAVMSPVRRSAPSPGGSREGRAQRLRKLVAARNEATQKELEERGCNALAYRERVATEKYARLIPTSWRVEHERSSQRRAALRSAATHERPPSASPARPKPRTGTTDHAYTETPAPSPTAKIRAVAFAGFDESHDAPAPKTPTISPRSRDRANRKAARALAVAVPGLVSETVDDAEWSNVSRASKALLHRGSSATPYAKRNLACDAARMGVAEQYIRCMPAYSVGKPYTVGLKPSARASTPGATPARLRR